MNKIVHKENEHKRNISQGRTKRRKGCAITFECNGSHLCSILFCSHMKIQTTNQKMAVNEQELSITVQRYTVLFDKEFHRKDVKRNAWKAVVQELGLEDGKSSRVHFSIAQKIPMLFELVFNFQETNNSITLLFFSRFR